MCIDKKMFRISMRFLFFSLSAYLVAKCAEEENDARYECLSISYGCFS